MAFRETLDCDVCLYRRTFRNGLLYPVNKAKYIGLSVIFEAYIGMCDEHVYSGWMEPQDEQEIQLTDYDVCS